MFLVIDINDLRLFKVTNSYGMVFAFHIPLVDLFVNLFLHVRKHF